MPIVLYTLTTFKNTNIIVSERYSKKQYFSYLTTVIFSAVVFSLEAKD